MARTRAAALPSCLALLAGLAGGCTADPSGPTPEGMPRTSDPGGPSAGSGGATVRPAPSDQVETSAAATSPAAALPCPATAGVEQATWVERADGVTLRVLPDEAVRACGGPLVAAGDPPPGWADLVHRLPDADTPGMREQYACHLRLAPRKDVWHLEPWRPVVTEAQMLASLCNPGSPDPDLATP